MSIISTNFKTNPPPPVPRMADRALAAPLERLTSGLLIHRDTGMDPSTGRFEPETMGAQARAAAASVRTAREAMQETNMEGAQSAIRDFDLAREMTGLARSQILTQSAHFMLGQANLAPERVLALLQ